MSNQTYILAVAGSCSIASQDKFINFNAMQESLPLGAGMLNEH
jgi:hypothetical protein